MKSLATMLALLLLVTAVCAQPSVRRRAGGWEARGQHFVVFSPNSTGEAEQLVAEMEDAWTDMAALADHWMQTHRQPRFGTASVNVRVLAQGHEIPPNEHPREIFLPSGRNEPLSGARLLAIRSVAVRAFMQVSEMDRKLPAWLLEGLTSYVAGELDTEVIARTRTTHELNAAWARALLAANDGQHAWQLFDALGESLQPGGANLATMLSRDTDLPNLAADWVKNPLAGQPLVKAPADLDAEAIAIAADMHDLLKLARRFPPTTPQPVRPRVVGNGPLVADPWATPIQSTTWPLRQVAENLLAANAPRFAMLDARGNFITSRNREHIQALFRRAEERLIPIADGDQQLLRATLHDGRLLEGWFSENREDAARPIFQIRIRRESESRQPKQES